MSEQPYVIEMRHISKTFGTLKANDDITLQLKRGEIHALLGENGAGKSTLMSILFGLYDPDTGMRFTNTCTPPLSALNLHALKDIPGDLEKVRGCDFVGYGNHEQYFFNDYLLYQPDYMDREMLMARTLRERGYRFIFMEDLV